MKKTLFTLLVLIFITVLGQGGLAAFMPIEVTETLDGKKSQYVEFIQITRQGNSVEMIMLSESIGLKNYNAFVLHGTVTSWASPSTARCIFETPTGAMLLNITFALFQGKASTSIEDLNGTSTSTSMLSGKTISKVYSLSKNSSHTIEIRWL